MLRIETDEKNRLISIEIEGRVTRDELREALRTFEAFVADRKPIKVLQIVRSFSGIEPAALAEDIGFSLRHMNSFSHAAVVTDLDWIGWWTRFAGGFVSAQVKNFPLARLEEARAWLLAPESDPSI
jgi:hypothetical protein